MTTRKTAAGAFPLLFSHNDDGTHAYARATTEADVKAGRAGAVGDYLVLPVGFRGAAQWWTAVQFEAGYSQLGGAELEGLELEGGYMTPEDAAAAIDPPAAPELEEPPPATPFGAAPATPFNAAAVLENHAAELETLHKDVRELATDLEELRRAYLGKFDALQLAAEVMANGLDEFRATVDGINSDVRAGAERVQALEEGHRALGEAEWRPVWIVTALEELRHDVANLQARG